MTEEDPWKCRLCGTKIESTMHSCATTPRDTTTLKPETIKRVIEHFKRKDREKEILDYYERQMR